MTWRAGLDQWLAQVAATVYADVPFQRALIGFEVDEDRDITVDKRYAAVLRLRHRRVYQQSVSKNGCAARGDRLLSPAHVWL